MSSAPSGGDAGSGSVPRHPLLAWGLCALGVVLFLVTVVGQTTLSGGPPVEATWGTEVGGFLWLLSFQSFLVVGALIAARRPENPIGWISVAAALTADFSGAAEVYARYALLSNPGSLPGGEIAAWISEWSWAVWIGLIGIFFVLLFPDGRLPSPRWRWIVPVALVGIVLGAAGVALTPGPLEEAPYVRSNPFGLEGAESLIAVLDSALVLLPVCVLLAAASLVVRYRRSSGVERLQLKWLALAVSVAGIWFFPLFLPIGLDPEVLAVAQDVSLVLWAGLPISAGIAILRYRLYQIDRVINRTIVYGALTAILVAGYVCSVLLIRSLLPISDNSPVAVAVSTLVMAALFGPLRTRIQTMVDRRFYRSRYDASRTLEGFATRLRQETDLDALTTDLLGVVGDTLQPAHASLWLRTTK
jgi:hypothetical protein